MRESGVSSALIGRVGKQAYLHIGSMPMRGRIVLLEYASLVVKRIKN